jgi:flagellar hook-associated protein FlgK
MSLVKIQGNASGTGEFTIAAPNSNTNRTLTLPDATGTVQVSGNAISGTTGSFSSDLSFNSGYGSAAVAYGCRAWVNFNGTGTVAIRGSGNVTSITDNNTGDYTVNFTTAMPDVNYMFVAGAQANGVANGPMIDLFAEGTTTTCRFRVFNAASATMDSPVCTFLAVR